MSQLKIEYEDGQSDTLDLEEVNLAGVIETLTVARDGLIDDGLEGTGLTSLEIV